MKERFELKLKLNHVTKQILYEKFKMKYLIFTSKNVQK